MEVDAGVDEFGREHFVVEAPRGRLGLLLGETERGFVVIRALDALTASDLDAWDEIDRRRAQLLRECVQVGDRIIAIEGDDVVHCSLRDVITRLSKLSAVKRRLTLARYHETGFQSSAAYDIEKLVLTRVPSGPLGLQICECIPYGAFVDDFQRLPDGAMTTLARHPRLIHRGCQIVNVNGVDVSSSSREQVVALLGALKDQEKQVVFYRATTAHCAVIFSVDSSVSERHLGFTVDENELVRCVITSIGPRGDPRIGLGDVLIGVNSTDLTTMARKDAIEVVKDTPLPRQLYFARSRRERELLPECYAVQIGPGPLGVNLDGERRDCARITGFTSPTDAERPEFSACARFVPDSFILSIGHLEVAGHDLTAISGLLGKLKQAAKTIVIGNDALLEILSRDTCHSKVAAPKGPLGVHFDGNLPGSASLSGFYPSHRINALNVSCLPLRQVTSLLTKLRDVPKELEFHNGVSHRDVNSRVIDVRLPAGPLGVDLKRSLSNKVIVDTLNADPRCGSTRVFDNGGVVQGSELVAIDGFDISKLEIEHVLDILRSLAAHEKVITFSTTRAAYERTLDPTTRPNLVRVQVAGNSSLPLQMGVLNHARLASELQAVPPGSRVVGVEGVDVRSLSLRQIVATLQSLHAAPQISIVFDTNNSASRANSRTKSAWLADAVSSVLSTSPSKLGGGDNLSGSNSLVYLRQQEKLQLLPHALSLSTIELTAAERDARTASPPPSPPRLSTPPASPPPQSPRASSSATSPTLVPTPRSLLDKSPSLARLSIQSMEATRSNTNLATEKQQLENAHANKTEYLINMVRV